MPSMMSGSRCRIGQTFGISIYVHSSWFIIFALISYSLATQFTAQHPTWRTSQHWTLGILASLLFFVSVLIHELGHSIVALRYRLPVNSITLFVFGGVSEIGREPAKAAQEFFIAAAGPATSFLLAGTFFAASRLASTSEMGAALFGWLAEMNLILAIFNLAPGFPLDGGRIFRAIAWGITGSFSRATRLAAHAGQIVAGGMILWGIFLALRGDVVGGVWLAFIGWFLLSAARGSLMQMNVRGSLDGLRAADATINVPVVSGSMTLDEYAQEVVRTGQRFHVVSVSGQLAGMVTANSTQRVPRSDWGVTSVQAIMQPWGSIQPASPQEPVMSVVKRMRDAGIAAMPVVENGKWLGVITHDSLLSAAKANPSTGAPEGNS